MKEIGIDHSPHTSLSGKIHSELRRLILNGELKAGERLPSEPDLAHELGVSRNSLREAIGLLQKEGLLLKKHGIGTFVTDRYPIIRGGIERLSSIGSFIESQGHSARSEIIRFDQCVCEERICEFLGLEEKSLVYVLETAKYASEIPVAVCIDFIPKSIVEEIDPNIIYNSVFEGLGRHYNIDIRYAECDLISTSCDEILSKRLKVESGTSVLLLEQIHYDVLDRKVLYSKSYFPSGKFTFKLIRRR